MSKLIAAIAKQETLAKREGGNLKSSTDLGELRFMQGVPGRFYSEKNGGA
jgi:hypothetical protein